MDSLVLAVEFMATELFNGRLPTASRDRLVAVADESSHLELADTISAVVILAQLRSIVTDLLELTGLDYGEARAAIPDMD
jgi:hypothetical protein